MNDRDLLWNQYKQNSDLFKFYMELIIKLETFYYAITGAIFSYYYAHSSASVDNIKYSLLLPLIMSLAFAGFFFYGAILLRHTREETFEIRDKLGLSVAPDVGVLSILLYIFASISIVIGCICIYILCCS